MLYTDFFIYVLIYSTYVGRSIVNGFTFGSFQSPQAARTVDSIAACMNDLFIQFSPTGIGTTIMDAYLALAGASQLTVNAVHMYGKYENGQTYIDKRSVSYPGIRDVGSVAILPGFVTGSIRASSMVFGERGTSYGLPGILPGDVSGDYINPSGTFYTEADNICNILNAGISVEDGVQGIILSPATVKRIPYTTANNKPASRMPYEPGDTPSVYSLNDFAVNTKLSYNQRRKAGNGQ